MTLERYVDIDTVSPTLEITVTREKNDVYIQAMDQPKRDIFALARDQFFCEASLARLTFKTNASGMVTELIVRQEESKSSMTFPYWSIALGFVVAVCIIWGVHKISVFHAEHRPPTRTRDRIWLLEKSFCGVAVSILILAHSKDVFSILQGGQPSEQTERDCLIAFLSFVGSAFILLIAKLADSLLGDE